MTLLNPTTTPTAPDLEPVTIRRKRGSVIIECGDVTLDVEPGAPCLFIGFACGQLVIGVDELQQLDRLLHEARVRTALGLA